MNIKALHNTLQQRKRPEDIAQMVLELLNSNLNSEEKQVLEKAAKGSLKNTFWQYTSMMQTFSMAIGAEKQITKAIELFQLKKLNNIDYNEVHNIEKFIKQTSILIYKNTGANNFLSDRLNKSERQQRGLDISKRNYNKKWRLLKRLENKLSKYTREIKKIELQKISKHGLAHTINFNEFKKDLNTSCFIAYYNSRCNLRSTFTNTSQERPFDEIANMLLNRCKTQKHKTNWWAISHIYTSQEVLNQLSHKYKGILLGKWTNILQETAYFLHEIWNANDINRQTMIVKKGNDSTTWNNTAGAWNKARDNWINLIYSLGLEHILNEICFGKVLRLMAGDVVAWHLSSGGQIDPNTEVWNKLPLPWEVFQNKQKCNKPLIIKYCNEVKINAETSGWIAPRVHHVAKFTPTPELVHGVSISNPYLANILRKQNYFSGKNKKDRLVQW